MKLCAICGIHRRQARSRAAHVGESEGYSREQRDSHDEKKRRRGGILGVLTLDIATVLLNEPGGGRSVTQESPGVAIAGRE